MTAFTRIIIVLSFVRKALSFQTLPPNQILIGISLFLTIFVMAPVWKQVNDEALQPYLKEEITQNMAFERALVPFQKFMLKQTREKDIALFVNVSKMERPRSPKRHPYTRADSGIYSKRTEDLISNGVYSVFTFSCY